MGLLGKKEKETKSIKPSIEVGDRAPATSLTGYRFLRSDARKRVRSSF